MRSKFLIGLLVFAAVIGLVVASLPSGDSDQDYADAIEKERREKDEYMKSSGESPFASSINSSTFSGLQYFPPDKKYRVKARLSRIEQPAVVVLATSTGEEERFLQYAWADFDLDGVANRLLVLEVMAMGPTRGKLFLAFADETSASETYGAGRYLDVKKVAGAGSIELDFNKAYNPYCAYTEKYTCPLPPKENILKVAIRGGEKSYRSRP